MAQIDTTTSSEEVTASTQEQLAGVEQLAGYAHELNSTASRLSQAINGFIIK